MSVTPTHDPDTERWEEAVAYGYFGDNVDPVEPDYYTVLGPGGGGGAPPPPAPVVASATPNSGPVAGGTSVVIAGSGFTGASEVGIANVAPASFTVDSDTQITAVTGVYGGSPGGSGSVYVAVGGAYSNMDVTFTYT